MKLDGHTHFVQSVCFSPDCDTLASDSWDNSIRLWDVKQGQYIQPFHNYPKAILAQFKARLGNNTFSEDGSYFQWYLVNTNIAIRHINFVFLNQSKLEKKIILSQGVCYN